MARQIKKVGLHWFRTLTTVSILFHWLSNFKNNCLQQKVILCIDDYLQGGHKTWNFVQKSLKTWNFFNLIFLNNFDIINKPI